MCWALRHFSCVRLTVTLWAARFLCPRDSPGKNTGVHCHSLPQEIFPTHGWNLCLLCLLRWQAGSFTTNATWTTFYWLGFLCPHFPWIVPDLLRLYHALGYNSSEAADLSNWISYAVCLRNAIIPRSTFNLNLEKFHYLSWIEAPILYISCFPFSWFTLSSGWNYFTRGFVGKTIWEINNYGGCTSVKYL